jgi:hypothetical protein
MREFDPDNPMMRREMGDVNGDSGAGLGAIGLLAGLAIAVALGFFFFMNTNERTNTAVNTAPGVTTGSSTTPLPALAPPRKDKLAPPQ